MILFFCVTYFFPLTLIIKSTNLHKKIKIEESQKKFNCMTKHRRVLDYIHEQLPYMTCSAQKKTVGKDSNIYCRSSQINFKTPCNTYATQRPISCVNSTPANKSFARLSDDDEPSSYCSIFAEVVLS